MNNSQEVYEIIHEFPREWNADGSYVKEWDYERTSMHRTTRGAWNALRILAADRDVELDRESTSFFYDNDEWYIDTATLED